MSENPMEYGAKLSSEQQQQLLFMMLVQQHEQIGMMGLGKLKDPSSDTITRDLNAAKYAIDTLRMLETYTKGNLTSDMKSYLTHVLSTLQLNYVDEVKKPASDGAAQATPQEDPADAPADSTPETDDSADTEGKS